MFQVLLIVLVSLFVVVYADKLLSVIGVLLYFPEDCCWPVRTKKFNLNSQKSVKILGELINLMV